MSASANPWRAACPDWRERLLSGRSLVPDLPLFRDEADRALRIFKRLRIPDLHGRPTMGEAAGPWLFPIVEALFGSYDVEARRRMIQEYFLLVPKKNGKTSTSAAIMVAALIVNRRPEAEFALVAPTKEIAGISFKQAAGIIRADEELAKVFKTIEHQKLIKDLRTGAVLQIKASDTDIVTGGKQVGTLIDELHVLSSKRNAADILVELRGAFTARPDGFLITITTQSKQPPAGAFKAELAAARAVRDGEIDYPLLPVLYELPQDLAKEGGWKDRKYWPLVNPNFGRSVDPSFLEDQLAKAEAAGREAVALFASQHFNIEVGAALHMDRWPGADYWEDRGERGLRLADVLDRSEVVVIGVDGGGLDDLLGFCLLGRERNTGCWLAWHRAYAHSGVFERRKGEAARLRDFEADGDLIVVDRMEEAFEAVAELAARADRSLKLAQVGLDPYGVADIVAAMARRGVEGEEKIVGVSQGYKLTGAVKMAEVRLSDGKLVHAGAPLMAWCVGNAKVELKGNALLITKQASGAAKIDPLMAMFNAVSLMSQNPNAANQRSVYEERGLRVI